MVRGSSIQEAWPLASSVGTALMLDSLRLHGLLQARTLEVRGLVCSAPTAVSEPIAPAK